MTVVGRRADQQTSVLAARIISEVLSPIVVIPLGTLIVSVHASGWLRGLSYGGIAVFFAAALPYAVLLSWVHSGKVADREVRIRQQRPAILALTLCSVSAGLGVLWFLNAPQDIFALMTAMVVGMAATLAVSTRCKISMHTSCLAGVITSVALLINPWATVLAALLPPTGWSRMLLKHHTAGQVWTGGAMGFAAACSVLSLVQLP